MNGTTAQTFILVHGAWSGGWVWRDVLPRLRALGHVATAPTLSGLGERRNVETSAVNLDTHVEDVVAHVQMEDLRDITLVGSSYGGAVITGVFSRIPERIKRIVYLDAFVPEDGMPLVAYLPPAGKAAYDVFREKDEPLPPRPLSLHGITDPALVAFMEPRLGSQPWRTFYQPVKACRDRSHIPVSYVVCTGYGPSPISSRLSDMEIDRTVQVIKINTSHYCMLTAVDETVGILINDDPGGRRLRL